MHCKARGIWFAELNSSEQILSLAKRWQMWAYPFSFRPCLYSSAPAWSWSFCCSSSFIKSSWTNTYSSQLLSPMRQLLKPAHSGASRAIREATSAVREASAMRSPTPQLESPSRSPQLEKAHIPQRRPSAVKNKQIKWTNSWHAIRRGL